MNILLVNNDSDTWFKLQTVVRATGHSVTPIRHTEIATITPGDFDIAILSGGWWYDDPVRLLQEYAQELELIRLAPFPILGICIGMQLMHVAIEQAVPLMDEPQSGDKLITVSKRGQELFGFPAELEVFKNHTRAIFETDARFETLAISSTTPNFTEMMIHKQKPLLGVQFHPEMGSVTFAAERIQTLIDGLLSYRAE